jgi:hypothetical protein
VAIAKKKKRGPGRPRTRPLKSGLTAVPLAKAERDAVNAAAADSGMSAAMWMRQELLRAAGYRAPAAIVS